MFNIDISGRLTAEITDVETGHRRSIVVDRNVLRNTAVEDFETRRRYLAEIAIL